MVLSHFVTTPSVSMASSAVSAHTGLSSTSQSSTYPPSSHVASPTSSPSYIFNIALPLLHLGLTCLALVVPTPPTCSASVVPTSPLHSTYHSHPNLNAWHLFCFSPICDTCHTIIHSSTPCTTIASS